MQADQVLARPSGGGTSALSVVALVTALLALALSAGAWWRGGMFAGLFSPMMNQPAASAAGYGYGMMPGMMPGGYGMMGPGMMMGPGAGAGMMGYGVAQQQTIAAALGITVDDLTAAERAGKSIATLAQDKGIDLQNVIDAVLAPRKAAMAAVVGAGRMTQDQADLMVRGMEAYLRARFATPFGPGAEDEYGPGYGMGPGYGQGMMPGYGMR
jgi:hypothetical protein